MEKKLFVNSESANCRWSECVEPHLGDWTVLWEEAYVDYQGGTKLLATKDGHYAYVEWSYGSCSGCDGWEDMAEDRRLEDFKNMIEYFDTNEELKRFCEQVNYGEDFEFAVGRALLDYEIEEELGKQNQRQQ